MNPYIELIDPATAAIIALTSAAVSLLIVLTGRWHGKHTHDSVEGVQKFHTNPTPRIGGIAILAALVVAWCLHPGPRGALLGAMIIAAVPAFLGGLIEDLTKQVGVRERLLATMLSGLAAWYLTGYRLVSVDVPGLNLLFTWIPFSVAFTAFAVGGVANAVNIIDGFNGLAGGVLLLCFGFIAAIALDVGDPHLAKLCILFMLCAAGFMLINFPFGKIFMGDGGAYFMGFLLAWASVMLPARNPEVSPWVPIVVCAYPLTETIYSMLRRLWKRAHPGHPDTEHLHSLIKVKLVRRYFGFLSPDLRNGIVSPFCWLLALLFAAPAIPLYSHTRLLQLVALITIAVYVLIHTVLSRMPEAGAGADSGRGA